MITVAIDVEAELATIRTPEGETTIACVSRMGGRPVFQITDPTGRVSTALGFREAVEYCVGRAIRSAAAIGKIRKSA